MISKPLTIDLKITIFTVPKPFVGHIGVIQRNAIQSWLALRPHCEIILCGDEIGMAQIASEFGLCHLSLVQCNDRGTPLLNDVFAQVHELATHSVLAYLNADIMLTGDFLPAIQQVVNQHQAFLLLGRRWNLDIDQAIAFEQTDWEKRILQRLHQAGIFGGIGALDYFVFPKPLFATIPCFAVGRAGWDNWMVSEALQQGYPVINASQVITAIHQNHDYGHLTGERLEAFHGAEAKQNRSFLKGRFAGSSADATVYLTRQISIDESRHGPRVSLVIAGQPPALLERSRDILDQQQYYDYEIVAVGRNGGTGLEDWPESSQFRYYPYSDSNLVAAWNYGWQQARGELVLFLDMSGYLLPDAIAHLVTQFESRVGSLEIVLSGWQIDKTDKTAVLIAPWTMFADLLKGREGLQGLHIWSLPSLWQCFHVSTVLYRRDWLMRFGGLDSSLSPHAAMLDLLLHLSSRGAAGIYLEEPTFCCSGRVTTQRQDLVQVVQDAGQILVNFFARSHLPIWMQPLRSQAEVNLQIWMAWVMYQANDWEGMASHLERSLQFSLNPYPATPAEIVRNWINQFQQLAVVSQQHFDGNDLTQSKEWQNLLKRLFETADWTGAEWPHPSFCKTINAD